MTAIYADSAYRLDAIPEQPPTDETVGNRRWRFNWRRGVRLAPGNYRHIPPQAFLETWTPEHLREIERKYQGPEALERPDELWDHQRIHMVAMGRLLNLLAILKGFGWAGIFILGPASVITALIMAEIDTNASFLQAFSHYLGGALLYFVLPASLGYLPLTIVDWINNRFGTSYVYRFRSLYELNRHTGQVTLYNRFSRPTFSAPFYEFDAYINTTPDRQGFLHYSLCLVHKYQPQACALENLIPQVQHSSECRALWDFLQCYMDISQPLPDIPLLEECRPLDPTTAAHDRKTDRRPDYWLTMDDKNWTRYVAEMKEKRQAAFG